MTNEAGTAIVPALWISLILALLATSLISISNNSVMETKVNQNLEKAWLKAEAGISIAAYEISKLQNSWQVRDQPYQVEFGGEIILVYVQSPLGKIDINGASPNLIRQLLMGLGYDQDIASTLADRIVDYRDQDDLVSLSGAEVQEYMQEGVDGPSNAPFESVSDLRNVLGLNSATYDCVTPFVTIFNRAGRIEPSYAPPHVRQVMGFQIPQLANASRKGSLVGQVFEITSDARYSNGSKARVTQIIRFTSIPSDPVWVHHIARQVVANDNSPFLSMPDSCPAAVEN